MAYIEVDEDNFSEIFSNEFDKNQIVILKFGSEFCEPCFALEYELEEIEQKHKKISVLSIDCNESPDLAEEYEVNQFPTMIIFENKDKMIFKSEELMLCQDIEEVLELN